MAHVVWFIRTFLAGLQPVVKTEKLTKLRATFILSGIRGTFSGESFWREKYHSRASSLLSRRNWLAT